MLFRCVGEVQDPKHRGEKVILKPVHPIEGDDKTEVIVSTWLLTSLFPKAQFTEGQVFDLVVKAAPAGESKPVTSYDISKGELAPPYQ